MRSKHDVDLHQLINPKDDKDASHFLSCSESLGTSVELQASTRLLKDQQKPLGEVRFFLIS